MCRREVFDDYLRKRAAGFGATVINGLMTKLELPKEEGGSYKILYNLYDPTSTDGQVGVPSELEVDVVVGADGANSRVATAVGAGDYDYAIAFQERIRISDEQMDYYKDLAEM